MLLVFGLSVFFRTVGQGVFHCPHCGGDRPYRRRIGRRWVTLFFLPVVPLRRVGEAVECRTCHTRFGVPVLKLPTVRQMTAALPIGMRAAVALVLSAGDPVDDGSRRRALEIVRGYGKEDYGPQALDSDLRSAAEDLAAEDLRDKVGRAGSQLRVEAKEWFLAQVVRVALADGPLSEGERQAVHRVAGLLGMTAAHALGVILTAEGAANP
ncbi:MAG TPA: TerB family tellurite resistance protein [Actinomadura sp.]|nr:TerB family tellurite resistance protein [Actinomadura sp.]